LERLEQENCEETEEHNAETNNELRRTRKRDQSGNNVFNCILFNLLK